MRACHKKLLCLTQCARNVLLVHLKEYLLNSMNYSVTTEKLIGMIESSEGEMLVWVHPGIVEV